jgi:hypothetical protein
MYMMTPASVSSLQGLHYISCSSKQKVKNQHFDTCFYRFKQNDSAAPRPEDSDSDTSWP